MTVRSSPIALGLGVRAVLAPADHAGTFGQTVVVRNVDATNTAHVGGPDVTADNGMPLAPGAQLQVQLSPDEELHGIAAAGAALRVLRTQA